MMSSVKQPKLCRGNRRHISSLMSQLPARAASCESLTSSASPCDIRIRIRKPQPSDDSWPGKCPLQNQSADDGRNLLLNSQRTCHSGDRIKGETADVTSGDVRDTQTVSCLTSRSPAKAAGYDNENVTTSSYNSCHESFECKPVDDICYGDDAAHTSCEQDGDVDDKSQVCRRRTDCCEATSVTTVQSELPTLIGLSDEMRSSTGVPAEPAESGICSDVVESSELPRKIEATVTDVVESSELPWKIEAAEMHSSHQLAKHAPDVAPESLAHSRSKACGSNTSECEERLQQSESEEGLIASNDERLCRCAVCCKAFSRNSMLIRHMRTHTGEKPFKCDLCPKAFGDSSNFAVHLKMHAGERTYKCTVCPEAFVQRAHLTTHLRTHSSEKPFECADCRKAFSNSSALTKHARVHTGEKPYTCSVCSRAFSDRSNLNAHARTHTGERPYACALCPETFTQAYHLLVHMRAHSDVRPYRCKSCDRAFSHSSHLKTHARIHTGEKPLRCAVCHESFSHGSTLKKHMRTHTGEKPYVCHVCRKAFTQPCNLTTHMRVHTGEKPYKCGVCRERFSHSSALTRHMRTHTGEKPYRCEVCQQAFTQNSSLARHSKTHSGDKDDRLQTSEIHVRP